MATIDVLVLLCLTVFAQTFAQIDVEKCADVSYVQDFKAEKFQGMWHQIDRYPRKLYDENCAVSNFSIFKDEEMVVEDVQPVVFHVTMKVANSPDELQSDDAKSFLFILIPAEEPQLHNATFWLTQDGEQGKKWVPMKIVDTNYENYAILYGCNEESENKKAMAFVLSRDKKLSDEFKQKVDDCLDKNGIDKSEFIHVGEKCNGE